MKRILIATLIAGIFIISCSLPAATPQQNTDIATAAALTVQAALEAAVTPLATSPTLAPQPAVPTPQSTPTSQPMISVGDVTNCRSGPGKNYDRITQVLPNEPVQIVGFLPSNYWVVSTVNGECWLSVEFATPSGNFGAVPRVTAPPTPLGGAPEPPTFSKNGWSFDCSIPGQASITLAWNDKADNESGYRVLRNGELVAELPADSTYYAETTALLSGQSVEYQIRAYNQIGEADSTVAKITCP
jgi:hypothetical protein